MMEPTVCLECDFECGSHLKLPFHYEIKHKDKNSSCQSGNCMDGPSSKMWSNTPKCSRYDSSSGLSFTHND